MTKEEVVVLVTSFIARFITELSHGCDRTNATKLAKTAGCADLNAGSFQDALKQLEQTQVLHFIGHDDCYFLPTEDYVQKAFTANGTKPLNDFGIITIQHIRQAKEKYLEK